jgi:hypothetical protein
MMTITTLKPLWQESILPSNHSSRIQDAASALLFGLRHGIFMGRFVLEDMELDALKEWLRVLSLTFPGAAYRHILQSLYHTVVPIAFLSRTKWDQLMREWQAQSVSQYRAFVHGPSRSDASMTEAASSSTLERPSVSSASSGFSAFASAIVPEWQSFETLFQGKTIRHTHLVSLHAQHPRVCICVSTYQDSRFLF